LEYVVAFLFVCLVSSILLDSSFSLSWLTGILPSSNRFVFPHFYSRSDFVFGIFTLFSFFFETPLRFSFFFPLRCEPTFLVTMGDPLLFFPLFVSLFPSCFLFLPFQNPLRALAGTAPCLSCFLFFLFLPFLALDFKAFFSLPLLTPKPEFLGSTPLF